MKIIQNGIPQSVYEWLCQDFYDTEAARGSISATGMKRPVQEYILTQRHQDEIEVDAADRIWSLFGSGIHAVLEKIEGGAIERLYSTVAGRKVSGKYDRIYKNEVQDYKVTSAWTLVFGSRDEDWKFQLSVYRWLYWKSKGVKLSDTGKIIAIIRDWNKRDSKRKGYPAKPIVEIPVSLYPLSATELMVEDRVRAIIEAEKVGDEELPECTKEERWWNEKAQQFNKCERFCAASKFCHQLKRANK